MTEAELYKELGDFPRPRQAQTGVRQAFFGRSAEDSGKR